MCKSHFMKHCSESVSGHSNPGIISLAQIRQKALKCQQRHEESVDTEGPLLDSCIFHDHITVSFGSVSKWTKPVLFQSECLMFFFLFYWLNIKFLLSFVTLIQRE